MKVIDLLNKIANREEVPKKIKITILDDRITKKYSFCYDEDNQEYRDDELFPLGARLILERVLNEKVEIIEEEQEEKEEFYKFLIDNDKIYNVLNEIYKFRDKEKIIEEVEKIEPIKQTINYYVNYEDNRLNEDIRCICNNLIISIDKINELIDAVNELKRDK